MARTITNERKIFKLSVTGGRDYSNKKECWDLLDRAHAHFHITHLINGDAPGLDRMADAWAVARGVQPVRLPALWNYYKNAAGPIRNQYMAELYPDAVLAFPGRDGTKNMIEQALRHGLRVIDAQKMINSKAGVDGRSPFKSVEGEALKNTNPSVGDSSPITRFDGEMCWLSNFMMMANGIEMSGYVYPSLEHAYQAAKTTKKLWRKKIREAGSPGLAKKLGRQIPAYAMRPDWENVKLKAMLWLLRKKFSQPYFKKMLLSTGNRELVEGNYWGDTFWGVDVKTGKGENWLGKLLMKVRDELR